MDRISLPNQPHKARAWFSGPAITRACQRTCGACSLSLRRVPQHDDPQEKKENEEEEDQEIEWKAMDFANLPGSLDRRPFFNSPYHYRFDWCALPSPHALLSAAVRKAAGA